MSAILCCVSIPLLTLTALGYAVPKVAKVNKGHKLQDRMVDKCAKKLCQCKYYLIEMFLSFTVSLYGAYPGEAPLTCFTLWQALSLTHKT
jgi:hypothetical protein